MMTRYLESVHASAFLGELFCCLLTWKKYLDKLKKKNRKTVQIENFLGGIPNLIVNRTREKKREFSMNVLYHHSILS